MSVYNMYSPVLSIDILWGRFPLQGFYLCCHVLTVDSALVYIMVGKLRYIICPPPQFLLHRSAAL
jgi:hypothetical protein